MAENIDDIRSAVEEKARVVTAGSVRRSIKRKKAWKPGNVHSMKRSRLSSEHAETPGKERRDCGDRTQERGESKQTANAVEETLLDPLYEVGALYRGIRRGVLTVLRGENEGRVTSASNR